MSTPYTPKPVRGQTFPGYIKVSTAQVKKLFANGQTFTGFIVGNKVASFHFFGGWHLACRIEKNSFAEFQSSLNAWSYYNANPETGNTPAIYLRKARKCNFAFPPSLPLLLA